jgi:signal transduction histidine kinase
MSTKKSYLLIASLINFIALVLIIVIHLYVVEGSISKYINVLMKDYRREIISGDRSSVLMRLGSKVGTDLGLVEIGYDVPGNRRKFIQDDYKDTDAISPWEKLTVGEIQHDIFYDESQRDRALSVIFYYNRFDNVTISLMLWLGFCLVTIGIWHQFYRSNVRREQAVKASEKADTLAQMARFLSHDMRVPLGVFESLLHLDIGPQFNERKGLIRASLDRLHAMIESIRYSETELLVDKSRHHHDFQFGIESLSDKARSKLIKIEIIGCNAVDIFADRVKFERAWVNLLSNAIDAAHSEAKLEIMQQKDVLVLRVIDDGPGVPDEFLPKLFQRGATFGKADGTGLGLAYVRQTMRGHGGDVTYRRENGLTIFECRLPNAVVEQEEKPVEIAASLELKMEQNQLKKVAICLQPESLSARVLTELASQKSEAFLFSGERAGAQIVVSNIDDIMFEVLEKDDQEFIQISESWGNEIQMISLLKRKFNLS